MTIHPYLTYAAPGIAELKPYLPGKPISELERELAIRDIIKLASNENPLGCGEKAKAAIQAAMTDVARYPDGGGFELRAALAAKHGLAMQAITLGNGSNDVLDLIARVFLCPGRESLFSEYAFAVYPISSQSVGATLVVAPAREYGNDLAALRERVTDRTGVIWIANPNNPTGTWVQRRELREFIASLPAQVMTVVDEAYSEYVDEPEFPDASRWLDEFPNLIVTRTFSKAYGLASLRVGYSLSHPDVADLLNRVRHPFNVNSFALAAARAALDDADFLQRSMELNQRGMAQLTAGFDRIGLEYIPSVGNFVTLDLGRPAGPLYLALLREGCIVRPVANYGLPNHLRVSIGWEQENGRFLESLEKVLKAC
jgi:histidinol-phosphate aminotransferase